METIKSKKKKIKNLKDEIRKPKLQIKRNNLIIDLTLKAEIIIIHQHSKWYRYLISQTNFLETHNILLVTNNVTYVYSTSTYSGQACDLKDCFHGLKFKEKPLHKDIEQNIKIQEDPLAAGNLLIGKSHGQVSDIGLLVSKKTYSRMLDDVAGNPLVSSE